MEATINEFIPYHDIDDELKTLYNDPAGYTYQEMADKLGVSSSRVQKRLIRLTARGEIQRNRGKGFRPGPKATTPSASHTL